MPRDAVVRGRISLLLWVAIAVAAVVVVTLMGAFGSRAKITGRTPDERIKCIGRLADDQPLGVGDVLAAAATEESDARVRRAALVALGKVGGPEHRQVIETATTDADADARAGAATALGRYRDPAAAEKLLALARQDPDRAVRLAAVVALDPCRTNAVTDGLIEVMAANSDPAVRRRAMHVLERRLGFRHNNPPDPSDPIRWSALVSTMRTVAAGLRKGQPPAKPRKER